MKRFLMASTVTCFFLVGCATQDQSSEASLCDQAQQAFATKIDVQLSNMGEALLHERTYKQLAKVQDMVHGKDYHHVFYNAKVRCVNDTPVVDDEYYVLKGDQKVELFHEHFEVTDQKLTLKSIKHNH